MPGEKVGILENPTATRAVKCQSRWMSEQAWLTEAPLAELPAASVVLRRTSRGDTDALVHAVNASLEHLRPWMPWARTAATSESIGAFLAAADATWEARTEFQYLITEPDSRTVLGCCGLHARLGSGALEIGYWVHVGHLRCGVAATAAAALTRTGLRLPGVSRIEIHCDVANSASAGVPRRLGFRLDRIERRTPFTPGETGAQMIWVE